MVFTARGTTGAKYAMISSFQAKSSRLMIAQMSIIAILKHLTKLFWEYLVLAQLPLHACTTLHHLVRHQHPRHCLRHLPPAPASFVQLFCKYIQHYEPGHTNGNKLTRLTSSPLSLGVSWERSSLGFFSAALWVLCHQLNIVKVTLIIYTHHITATPQFLVLLA